MTSESAQTVGVTCCGQIIKGCFLMVGEAGVPAAEVSGGAAHPDPKLNCVLVADVAPGQSLGVQYANYAGDYPRDQPRSGLPA